MAACPKCGKSKIKRKKGIASCAHCGSWGTSTKPGQPRVVPPLIHIPRTLHSVK